MYDCLFKRITELESLLKSEQETSQALRETIETMQAELDKYKLIAETYQNVSSYWKQCEENLNTVLEDIGDETDVI